MMKKVLPFAVLAGSFALTACQTMPQNTTAQPIAVDAQPAIFIPKTPTLQDLQRYDWELLRATDSSGKILNELESLRDFHQVKLNFEQNRLSYTVGCNHLTTSFNLSKNILQTKANPISTLMACDSLATAETSLINKMQGRSELSIDSNSLSLLVQKTADNSTLNWEGKLKPEVKYGKGETVFFEVKPEEIACTNLLYKGCLQVREVQYNSQGLKTGMGNWHILYDPIEGYQHSTNLKQIIRVNRYRTPPKDTMGYGNVYVLDSVIESEILK